LALKFFLLYIFSLYTWYGRYNQKLEWRESENQAPQSLQQTMKITTVEKLEIYSLYLSHALHLTFYFSSFIYCQPDSSTPSILSPYKQLFGKPRAINMPSILEDPATITPAPRHMLHSLEATPHLFTPIKTTLKTGKAVTLYPITNGPSSLPQSLLRFLHAEFSAEIERGCTYPMEEAMDFEKFGEYWFGVFGVVALLDSGSGGERLSGERDWERECLGTFYIKPNYPGMFLPFL
jgi:hypothetical protein